VTEKVCVPPFKAAFAGRMALLSDEAVIPTLSATVLTKFQKASTAFTVTLKGTAAVCAAGVPDLPETVPGALDSPGASNCSLTKAAGLMAIVVEIVLLRLPLVKLIVILAATLCERLVKV